MILLLFPKAQLFHVPLDALAIEFLVSVAAAILQLGCRGLPLQNPDRIGAPVAAPATPEHARAVPVVVLEGLVALRVGHADPLGRGARDHGVSLGGVQHLGLALANVPLALLAKIIARAIALKQGEKILNEPAAMYWLNEIVNVILNGLK